MKSRILGLALVVLSLSRVALAQVPNVTSRLTAPPAPRAVLLPPTNRDPFDYSKDVAPDCKPQVVSAPTGSSPNIPVKTAAQTKAEEAEAAKRQAAIHHLGTVPSHQCLEMESELISGLRADPSEAVRFEAAIVLSKCGSCSKRTIAALMVVVNGSTADGNPAETSERVKAAALRALQIYTSRLDATPVQQLNASSPAGAKTRSTGVQLAAYNTQPMPDPVPQEQRDQACRLLAETISASPPTRAQLASATAFNNATRGLTKPRSVPPAGSDAPQPLARPQLQPRPAMLTGPPAVLQEGR